MIVTITGLPGNGKTLYALVFVQKWASEGFNGIKDAAGKLAPRKVFFHGIKGLKLGWEPIATQEVSVARGETLTVPRWWDAPAGSIVVIDEAQNCGFGVRGRGDVPEWARKLETHRHLGIDLVFITQNPSLLDSHDRKLSERHFHVIRKFGLQRAVIHEYKSGVREGVEKKSGRTDSIRHEWKFPKEAFGWYESAEAHTHKAHVPMRVWVFLALPFVLAALVWFTWTRYLDPTRSKSGAPATSSASSSPAAGPRAKLTAAEYVDQFAPRVPGLAYTAPVYDDITKPISAPYPAACVSMGDRCQCYTQQGTRLDVPKALCVSIAAGGFFVAWAQPVPPPAPPLAVPARSEDVSPVRAGIVASGRSYGPSASILPQSRTEDLPPGRGGLARPSFSKPN